MNGDGAVLRFDLPVHAPVANLTGAPTGVSRLVAAPPREETATVIDTGDHRLLDWGVELWRVAETGRWVLRAPGWAPALPAEQRSPHAEDELPPAMADLLVPFRRGAILGPKLKVVTQRRRFGLHGPDDEPVGEVVDERVEVSHRGGTLTSFRTITLRVDGGVDWSARRTALTAAFVAAGGTAVQAPVSLPERLGLPGHRHWRSALSARDPIDDFVRTQLESRWRRLLFDDLTARTAAETPEGRRRDPVDGPLRAGLRTLGNELLGLQPLLDPQWRSAAARLIDEALAESGPTLLRSPRWLRILDLLAQGSAEAPLVLVSGRVTGPVLAQELEAVVQSVGDQCRTLDGYADDERWRRAGRVTDRALALSTLSRDVFGKPAKQLRKSLLAIQAALADTVRPDPGEQTKDLRGLTPVEIFEAGRAYERSLLLVDYAREQFVREWPGLWELLRARVIRPRIPHGSSQERVP